MLSVQAVMQTLGTHSISAASEAKPASIPQYVYRVHRAGAQTKYDFSTGFRSKNQTTIINTTPLLRQFALAHINGQTNVSSPFVSVYDSRTHAENMARYYSQKYSDETKVVQIDTRHLGRGPVFRVADLLEGKNDEMGAMQIELHKGEYLVLYKIPPHAVVSETPVGRGTAGARRGPGVIGRPVHT